MFGGENSNPTDGTMTIFDDFKVKSIASGWNFFLAVVEESNFEIENKNEYQQNSTIQINEDEALMNKEALI